MKAGKTAAGSRPASRTRPDVYVRDGAHRVGAADRPARDRVGERASSARAGEP